MPVVNKDILIIDDDKEIRVLMRKMLEVVGANVQEKESVEEALRHSLASPPHLILLDLKMPRHSGFDFLMARNKSPILQKVPVVVVSGSRDKESIYRAISLGAADYVVKPLQTKTILQKVRKYLKDNAFFRYEFPKDQRPAASLQVSGEVTAFNKTYFKLEAPVKIEKNTTVKVEARVLKKIGGGQLVMKTANYPALYLENKRYLNTVQMVGATAEEIKQLKEAMKKFG